MKYNTDNKFDFLIVKPGSSVRLIFSLAFSLLVLYGCVNKTENSNKEINLNKSEAEIDLKLSDVADSLEWIALETNPNCIISGHSRFYLNDKYILAIDPKRVLQFSENGDFIREVTRQGNGPNEFVAIRSFTVNDEKDILYFQDHGKYDAIRAINLRNGEHLPKITFRNNIVLNTMSLLNDSTFICTASDIPENGYRIFSLSTSGKIKKGFIVQNEQTEGPVLIPKQNIIFQNNALILFHDDNRLFRITENNLEQILGVDKPTIQMGTSSEGTICTALAGNNNYILYKASLFEVIRSQEGTFVENRESTIHLAMIQEGLKSYKIRSFTNDLLSDEDNTKLEDKFIQYKNGRILIPYSLIELEDYSINGKNRNIISGLDENSNPIFIVGIIKQSIDYFL